MNRFMNRFRWWHRLRGHRIGLVVPDFDKGVNIIKATTVVDRCTCGDRWVFSSMIMREFYIRAGPP